MKEDIKKVFQMVDINKHMRISIYLLMAFFSISLTMISPMLPVIVKEFELTTSQGGLIMTYQSIGGALITVLMMFIADKYDKAMLIIIGFFLLIVSLFLISFVSAYNIILLLFFLYGVGSKIGDNLNNSFLTERFSENSGVYLNILHGFFGIGALLGPLIASGLINQGIYWGDIFKLVGFVSLFVLVYFIVIVIKDNKISLSISSDKNKINYAKIFGNYKARILYLIMLLYIGSQSALSTWLPMYMENYLQTTSLIGGLALSLFWIGNIISRFMASYFTQEHSNIFLIKWGNFLGFIVLFISIILQIYWLTLINVVLIGFFTGATVPLVLDIASGLFPDNNGAVTSVLFVVINLSVMFFPWFIGLLVDHFDFQIAFIITAIILLAVPLISLLIKEKNNC